MPNDFDAPSDTPVAKALEGRGLAPRPSPLLEPGDYYDLLAPPVESIDLWETRCYPRRGDGKTELSFRRLFLVAVAPQRND